MRHSIYTVFLFLFFTMSISAQNTKRAIAILDLSVRNNETNDARLFSVEHIIKVVGVPYIITQDVAEADNYAMVFCSAHLAASTFTSEEKVLLIEYVENEGLLFAPRIEDEELFSLFGIDGFEASKSRYEINWNTATAPNADALRWIDEPEERTIPLGRSTYDEIYKTLGYQVTTAQTLAYFADSTSAITKNVYGDGLAVSIGLSWKEVILRNQINRDYEAQRITSNGFEPTSDVFMLFVRAIYAEHNPFSIWKHTSPGNSRSTLMVTHDIDSRSGMDTLKVFVDYEQKHNIEATYNVTVRYFSDELMSSFYLDRQSTMEYIQDHGQAFGSHSVGHFFDFADEDVFPIGEPSNTIQNYHPYNDGDITTGGTVYGECEVSKNTLEKDIDINIRTFRAGHLAYPKNLVSVLDALEYEYNSSNSASDVLTNFPYQNKKGRSFSGEHSSIYELPVTISDVFPADPISDANYLNKAETWLDVTFKNRANYAPTVLLIHPNRAYKLAGMSYYLDQLPNDVYVMEMSRFGDFWKARERVEFESHVLNNELTILVPGNTNLDNNISFIVNDGQSLDAIVVKDEQNNTLNFSQEEWDGNDVIVYYNGVITNTRTPIEEKIGLSVFPNPTRDELTIEFELGRADVIQIDLFDIDGKKVISLLNEELTPGKHSYQKDLSKEKLTPGIYFVVGKMGTGIMFRKKIVLM